MKVIEEVYNGTGITEDELTEELGVDSEDYESYLDDLHWLENEPWRN